MEQLTIEIPDDLAQEIEEHRDQLPELLRLGLRQQQRIQFALREYQQDRASIGHAAFLAGLTVTEMIEQAVKHGVEPHWSEQMIRQELGE